MLCKMSHNSFFGPSKPYSRYAENTICFVFCMRIGIRQLFAKFHWPRNPDRFISSHMFWPNGIFAWKIAAFVVYDLRTFFGLSPCRNTCSSTMKKCCNGTWSESSIRPKRRDCSNNSLTTNLQIFTKLLRSMAAGSRAILREQKYNKKMVKT